ncbi:hypothetical protein CAPN007_10270 [Capnocytophaga canimorsus]|nr:hypothetical protein [Capnocytophaga canimorsus]GIM58819.1 hypothetical protein CAPN007_10270 [Capnocytophaga canimorsus]
MRLTYMLLGIFGVLLSCKNVEEIKVAPEAALNTQEAEARLQAQRQNSNPISGQNQLSNPILSSVTGSKINPPHGEPGHRCDIPVGAPLDSPSVAQNQQPVATMMPQSVQQEISVTPQPTTPMQTAAGFSGKPNPPHGEPGHRCDISVGAILP